MKNKKSVWSTIILVVAILMAVATVVTIVTLIVQIPGAKEAAMQELVAQGYSESVAEAAVDVAIGSLVAGYIFGLTFNAFEAIGGFLFSLKGKWGMFCIVASIIAMVFGFIRVITNSTNGSDGLTIALNFVDLVLAILFCIASFKHRKENQELAAQEQAQ